jgi:hypothetical protein
MATLTQRSFSGGELTPSLYARTDISKYVTSIRTARNFIILKYGGARTRPGTKFVGEVLNPAKKSRLIPFSVSRTQNFVCEFGDDFIRFINSGAQIVEAAKNITAITNATPPVVTSTAHGFTDDQHVFIESVGGMTELNGRTFRVDTLTADTFELLDLDGTDINATGYGTYTSGGTAKRLYRITGLNEAGTSTFRYAQSVDVLTIPTSNNVYELVRTSNTNWSFYRVQSDADIPYDDTALPAYYSDVYYSGTITLAPSPTGLTSPIYILAAVDINGREGMGKVASTHNYGTSGTPNTISWNYQDDVLYWKLYKRGQDVADTYGLLAEVANGTSPSFVDDGDPRPNFAHRPGPQEGSGSSGIGWKIITGEGFSDVFYPVAVTYYQQRIVFGGGIDLVSGDTVRASAIGNYYYFEPPATRTLTDASPVTFTVAGTKLNAIKHLVDLNGLIIFTEGSEILANGDSAGTLTPTGINLRTQSYNGCTDLIPIVIDNIALYVQASGSIVRDIYYAENAKGYTGNEISIFSNHLFEGYTIVDWTYQKNPNSIVWAVRDDGILLSLTYLKEHDVLAWTRHDLEGGLVENVCAIPEGEEDGLYLVVKRTINGKVRRYIERMNEIFIDDIKDVKNLDCHLTYDGRHTGSTTMTLSGGSTWAYDETITLTASGSTFTSADVGREIHLTGSDGTIIRFRVETYSSVTVVTGKPNKTVPVGMRSVAIATWARAVNSVSGLFHLEGEDVSVFADGFVVANPNNDAYDVIAVANGTIDLDQHYSVIHVGLPYTCDLETLDIDTSQGETARDKKHIVSQVSMFVEKTRGLWVGRSAPTGDDPLEDLYEVKVRDAEDMDSPVSLKTETIDVKIQPEWNSNGRIFIRQVDPVPATILSIMPEGNFTLR